MISRTLAIAVAVVLLHVGFIWALYSGLLLRAAEMVVPVVLLSQLIESPAPKDAPPPSTPTPQVKKAISKAPTAAAPLPVAISDPTPTPNAPTGATAPQTPPVPSAATVAASPVAAALNSAAATPSVQLPSSDADYLQNPRPPYPAISRRLNEQGKTMVRVLIGADGQPQRAEIAKSSGYTRLDDAAIATVMRWRYAPGKRGGVAESMWFDVPINWVLE